MPAASFLRPLLRPRQVAPTASDRPSVIEALEERWLLATDTLVPAGSTWRYLDNGSNQGTGWYAKAFSDATWKTGQAQLGYGDGDEATRVGYGTSTGNKFITTYFRHSFSVADPTQYTGLTLNLLRDDGAVVYVNGRRVVKSNMPADPITYTTRASSAVTGTAESQFSATAIDPSYLEAGTNVIAVEVHQSSADSTDLSFDLSLSATRPDVPPPPPPASGDFTVLMLPDTQFYAQSHPAIFDAQIDWVVANKASQNIVFLSHVGDVVQDAARTVEWQVADAAMDQLDGVMPYSVAIGNHDYAPKDTRSGAGPFTQWFGSQRYAGRSWYGGSSADQLNHYQIFGAASWQFLHITIEWEARDSAIAWAQGVINAHPNLPVILTTHAYIEGASGRSRSVRTPDGNTGEQIFQKLVRPNPQIFMTLNGHYCGEAHQTSTNAAGRPVFELLADYQCRINGGDGWLRLLKFRPSLNRIDVQTYSPTLGRFETDANSQFSLPIDFASRFNFGSTAPKTATFRQGVNGYTGVKDTMIQQTGSTPYGPNANHAAATTLNVDDTDDRGGDSAVLLRFDNLFSTSGGVIPMGSTITSATLTLQVSGGGSGFSMHRMLQSWGDTTATWNGLGNGVQADGIEALAAHDARPGAANANANIATGTFTIDVTASVRAWAAGATNYGWVLLPLLGGSNGLDFHSSESGTINYRPMLSVQYV